MIAPYKEQLNQIITLSLSILDELGDVFDEETKEPKLEHNEKLIEESKERDQLIKLVFTDIHLEKYQAHQKLIDEIKELDQKISDKAQENKLAIKNSLISFKKNQKAVKSYKKY